jgi:hypothetical protein
MAHPAAPTPAWAATIERRIEVIITTEPDEAKRRLLFAELVARQDQGYSVAASRAFLTKQHPVTPAVVRAIEEEGIENDWPPLGD